MASNFFSRTLVFVIPFFFLLSLLPVSKFSFWENKIDSDYAYLFNGLNVVNTYGDIGHFDHPGTTVQVANAVLIKFFYLIDGKKNSLQEDVLYNPEFYLKCLAWVYSILNFISSLSHLCFYLLTN